MSFVSSLEKSLATSKFTITGELTPPKSASIEDVLDGARLIKNDVVATNVTDNPTSRVVMSTLATCHLIEKQTGLETIFQITCRDRNRLALQSDILAANALGIKNILVLTGDYITMGDHPEAKPVFDLDSVQLLWAIKRMQEEGLDLAGKKLKTPPKVFVGAAVNPGLDPIEPEIIRLEKKVDMGAKFAQSQCLYDPDVLEKFMDQISHLDVKILVGITPLLSAGMAKWMIKNCPGVIIPDEMIKRLKQTEDKVKEGIKMMVEVVSKIAPMKVAGIHVMVPERADLVAEMLKAIKASGVV